MQYLLIAIIGIVVIGLFVMRGRSSAPSQESASPIAITTSPILDVTEPDLLMATAAVAFVQYRGPIMQGDLDRISHALKSNLNLESIEQADDLVVAGRGLLQGASSVKQGFMEAVGQLRATGDTSAMMTLVNILDAAEPAEMRIDSQETLYNDLVRNAALETMET